MSESAIERLPSILIIDDNPDQVRATSSLMNDDANVEVMHPREVTEQELYEADLILVDYLIKEWAERENASSLAMQPMNGLALASVLRAHLNNYNEEDARPSPTAIALLSGQLNLISGGLSSEIRAHAIARVNNLEWAFEKGTSESVLHSLSAQFVSLADAVRQLPSKWPSDPKDVEELAKQFLRLPEEGSWSARAWADIEDCHPPLHELSTATHGLALLRWILHRILPYPCFLLDEWYLAARLRVSHESLGEALKETAFLRLLESAIYAGPLSNFLGLRWWRAGIESLLWSLTDSRPFDADAIRQRISDEAGVVLVPALHPNPVVCLNEIYAPLPNFYSADESVRIQPDDWPSFAEQAWTTIDLALSYPLLSSLVVQEDRDRLFRNTTRSSRDEEAN